MVDTWGGSFERSAFLLRSSRPAAGCGSGAFGCCFLAERKSGGEPERGNIEV